ncbi:MAG: endonuclease/exonuclease/phosphatase family protein [Cyanobacteria bacterium TGS_CYA1]|nr:endonuclease/exonuclease/phosphatase family protein [Cyanobacteria bacterium TGS_CYA1]
MSDSFDSPSNQEDIQTHVMDAAGDDKKGAKKKEPKAAMELSLMMVPLALVGIGVSLLGFVALASAEGDMGFVAEMCSSLRCQVIIVLLISAVPFLFTRSLRLVSLLLVILASANIALLAPMLMPMQKKADPKDFLSFQVFQTNLENKKAWEELVKQIRDIGPDVFCVENLDEDSSRRLNEQLPFYHRGGEFPDAKGTGIGIFCNHPMSDMELKKLGPDKLPVVFSKVKFEFGDCNVVVLSAPVPTDSASFKKRNEYLEAVSKEVSQLQGPVVVTGLFNITPYGAAFSNLLKSGNYVDGRKGNGFNPNFHFGPTDIVINRFPVDHFLVSQNMEVQQYAVKPNALGGSHAPILGRFQIDEAAATKSSADVKTPLEDSKEAPKEASDSKTPEESTSVKKKKSRN